MKTKGIDSATALANMRGNPHSRWGSAKAPLAEEPGFAVHRLKEQFVRLQVDPRLGSGRAETPSVYAIGSCFARGIERSFQDSGYPVLSFDASLLGPTDFASRELMQPWPGGAETFLNRYTTASMLQEVRRILDDYALPDDALLLGPEDRLVDLHFVSSVVRGDRELVRRRRQVTRTVGARIATADLVVLTLGLIEAWYDNESEAWMSGAPHFPLLQGAETRCEMRVLSLRDNLDNLERIYHLLRRANPTAQIVVTVSPVPLLATFTRDDVVVANAHSKATLLTAARELCQAHDDILYFPSYEMVVNSDPNAAWLDDRRHVSPAMVQRVVKAFREAS